MNSKKNIAVIFGGMSSEYNVSLVSTSYVIDNIPSDSYNVIMVGITKDGRWYRYKGPTEFIRDDKWLQQGDILPCSILPDSSVKGLILFKDGNTYEILPLDVVFAVMHGRQGEDGSLQALFEMAKLPYVGCDSFSSVVCMNKVLTNMVLDRAGIKQVNWDYVTYRDYYSNPTYYIEKFEASLNYPIFVKPANTGSSIGISKAGNREQLEKAIELAFSFDKRIVIEEGVDGIEVEVACMGNDICEVSVVGEIVPDGEFYDYDAKYVGDSKLYIPARIPPRLSEKVRQIAQRAYYALGCEGLTRIDFFIRRDNQEILLNEPNTIPGFTSISMFPKLFAAGGIEYPQLLDKLIRYALERKNKYE